MPMNKMRYFFPLSLILILIITSCTKEPNKKYYLDLEKPADAPALDFGIHLKSDTVVYYGGTFFILPVKQGKYKIITARCILDGVEWQFGNRNDTLIAKFYDISDGSHKLQIEIVINSASNSIADKLEAEGYKYTTPELTLIKKSNLYPYREQAKLVNNQARLSWKEYECINFKTYRIKKLATKQVFETTENTYVDSQYSGEDGIYDIYVVDMENIEHTWAQNTISGNLPLLKIGFVNNKLALTWKPTRFANKVKEYQVFQAQNWGSWQYLATVSRADSLLILNNCKYGDQTNFYLYSVPYDYVSPDYIGFFYSSYSGPVYIPGPAFNKVKGASCNTFYCDKGDSVVRHTVSTDKTDVITVEDNTWDISPNSKYMVRCPKDEIELYELNPLTKVKSLKIRTIIDFDRWTFSPLKVSDNGICVISFYSPSNGREICIYDLVNDRLIVSKPFSKPYNTKISADGKYMSLASDSILIYKINQNSITPSSSYKLSETYKNEFYCGFNPNKSDQFYLFESPNLKIISSSDFSTIRSIPLSGSFCNIDFCGGKILSSTSTQYYIYNYNTGNLIQNPPSIWSQVTPGQIWLLNNTIFYPGNQYPITQ